MQKIAKNCEIEMIGSNSEFENVEKSCNLLIWRNWNHLVNWKFFSKATFKVKFDQLRTLTGSSIVGVVPSVTLLSLNPLLVVATLRFGSVKREYLGIR